MKSVIISTLLAASVSLLSAHHAAAQPKKGGPPPAAPATTSDEGPVVVLKDLKPGTAVRVKRQNVWVDGTVVEYSEGSGAIRVQIGGSKEYFESEKVWGTEEQRDNEAAGGYVEPGTRTGFAEFKKAVVAAETLKKSGASADQVREAVEKAEQILTQDYGRAGRHPRIGPFLARYWALALSRVDEIAAQAVAEAKAAVDKPDFNFFVSFTYPTLKRAEAVLADYKAFQTTPNAETERLDKVIVDARAQIDASKLKVDELILAAARVPKESYKGSDAKALKAKVTAAWKKNFPDRKIIKIVINTDWKQDREWRTNASGGYWYDFTSIGMDLVVKKDATTVTAYPVGVTYQGQNKNKMTASATDRGFGNWVPYDVLLKNLNAK